MAEQITKESQSPFDGFLNNYRNGKMSALVGAGLSMNVSKHFLSWKTLMRDAVEFLYKDKIELHCENYCHINPKITPEEAKNSYINSILDTEDLLQIASDYIKKKGYREAIDYYIECKIPFLKTADDGAIEVRNAKGFLEYISENALSIHKALLQCKNFLNIYTTNYDNTLETALEFAKEDPSISYSIVKCGKDLSGNLSRNIVKIHGSLPDSGNGYMFDGDRHLRYIIAKEDYATYLQKHEAFSYLMRIAMLQGSFCLIGFSGSDPNYMEWVKWMSDILDSENGEKIYLLDIDGADFEPDIKSFYKNHHIAVINLWSEDVLKHILENYFIQENHLSKTKDNEDNPQNETEIRSVDSLILKKEEYESLKKQKTEDNRYYELHSIINDYKRIILEELFKYLKQHGESSNYDLRDETDCISPSLVESKTVLYDYRLSWEETVQSLYKNKPLHNSLLKTLTLKESIRFVKVIFPQEQVINHLMTRESLTNEKANLFALAVSDIGQIPSYYNKYHKDDVELNKLTLWGQLKSREQTLRGNEDPIEITDDVSLYEQIQRRLFHLDFSEAKKLICKWNATDYWIQSKAMRMSVYSDLQTDAIALLEKAIEEETNPTEKLFEVILANFISRQWPRPYSTEEFWRYGIDGQGDLLNSMMSSLRGKEEKPKRRNWIGTTHYFGDGHGDYCRSLRILQFIIDSGIYLNLPGTYMFEVASWYRVFTNLYEHFPYPCFFYSIQYNDKDVLRRIGEDFAYNEGLQDFVQDILLKSLSAITNPDTPPSFKVGILNITAAMYVAVNEDLWFERFSETIFKEFCEDIKNEKNILLYNVKFAVGSLKNPDNIKAIFQRLLGLVIENKSTVSDIIVNNLMVDRLSSICIDEINIQIKNFLCSDIIELLYTLNSANLLSKSIREELILAVRHSNEEDLPKNRVPLCLLANLVCEDSSAIEKIKQRCLSLDIWHCGVLNNNEFGWTEPQYILLPLLNEKITWTDEEFDIIKHNLIKNVATYNKNHERLHEDSFMKSTQVKYLSNILKYIDGLNDERKTTLDGIRKDVEDLLADRVNYEDNIDFMMSDQSADVDYAFGNIYEKAIANGIETCKNDVDFLIDRAIMKQPVALTRNIKCIKFLMDKCRDEIINMGYDRKMNKLLSVYMDPSSWQSLDLRFAFNYLHSIAKSLNEKNLINKDCAQFWLNNTFVKKFVID